MDKHLDNSEQFDTSRGGGRPCTKCGQHHEPGGNCSTNDGEVSQAPPRADNLIGKTVGGKYQIISLLGTGGMSRVYKARQLPINRVVALKMLQSQLSSEENSVMRFLQEARATGQISHPNVVNVFDFGIAEDFQPYLVMDYLEGETLSHILSREGRLPYQEAIPIFEQICDGLAAAHEHGVIHRDIKPSNIVLQQVPEGRRVRLVDFGIAKMIDVEAQHLTRTGEVFGSPFYMSPEQCEGLALDKRSDIYSLGVVLYETLSGKLPLAGRSAIETMSLHMQAIPPGLRKAAGDKVDIPLALENIVFKMMERNREKRQSSMLEVKQDLLQIASGQREALSGNLSYVRRELARKSRGLAVSLVAVTILGLSGVIIYPHACAALAKEQYGRASQAFSAGKVAEAEPLLKTAVDLSRQAGDISLESRSLSALVQVYRQEGEGKRDLLQQARERRRELIKALLNPQDVGERSIESLMEAGKAGDNPGNAGFGAAQLSSIDSLEGANLLASSPAKRKSVKRELPNVEKEMAGDGFGVASPASPAAAPMQEHYLPAASRVHPQAPSLQGATNGTTGPASNDAVMDRANGASSFVRTAAKPTMPECKSDVDAVRGTMRRAKCDDSLKVIDSRGDVHISAGAIGGGGGLSRYAEAGAPAGGADAGFAIKAAAAASANMNSRAISHGNAADADSKLDRLQAILELCLEKKLYSKARQCADKGIQVYADLNLPDDRQLGSMYCARAWSRLNLKEGDRGLSDLEMSRDLARKSHSLAEEAQAEGVKAVLCLESGNKDAARECFARASQIVERGVSPTAVLSEAMKKYTQEMK